MFVCMMITTFCSFINICYHHVLVALQKIQHFKPRADICLSACRILCLRAFVCQLHYKPVLVTLGGLALVIARQHEHERRLCWLPGNCALGFSLQFMFIL